jgi:hypothetical protein
MIKKLSSLLIISLLASCSIKYNPEAIPIARELIFGAQDIKIDSNYLANEKASFAKIKFGRSYIIIPALTSVDDEDIAKWETVSDEVIYTQDGKILSIAGFDYDVFVTGFKSIKFNKDNSIKRAFNISLNNPSGFFTQNSEFIYQDQVEFLHLEDKKVNANLFYEYVRTNGYKWAFVNKYWVDPSSGLVLKTTQKIHPRLPSLTIHYYYKFSRG